MEDVELEISEDLEEKKSKLRIFFEKDKATEQQARVTKETIVFLRGSYGKLSFPMLSWLPDLSICLYTQFFDKESEFQVKNS